MRFFELKNGSKTEVSQLSYVQSRQAVAVADDLGRLIPQPGVDYDVDITFNGSNVSLSIIPITDKGQWWQTYVKSMIVKYPPTVENPNMSLLEEPPIEEKKDEKNMS